MEGYVSLSDGNPGVPLTILRDTAALQSPILRVVLRPHISVQDDWGMVE